MKGDEAVLFTKLGYVVAFILFALGIVYVAVGFIGPPEFQDPTNPGPRMNSGQMIDRGFLAISIAIVLGVLCEISLGVRERNQSGED